MKLKINDKVIFKNEVVARCGHSKEIADMRGIIVDIFFKGKLATVETNGTFVSEEGNSKRTIPINNLTLAK